MTPLRSKVAEAVRGRLARLRRWRTGGQVRDGVGVVQDRAELLFGGDEVETQEIDPAALAVIVRDVRDGDLDAYLVLAEIMEERDPVYRSVIGTRKLAVQGLTPRVDPAGDDAQSIEIAEAVERDIVRRPIFRQMLFDVLDGIAKGYAGVEIAWDTEGVPWKPRAYRYVDPRWLKYAAEDDRPLLRVDTTTTRPLARWEWIVHAPPLKAGRPFRAGLALPAAYYYLLKTFDVASWMAFVEVYGYPLRIGKYPPDATKAERKVLAQAVMNLGRDVGAVIPMDMLVEIMSMPPGSNISHYKDLAEWSDRQMEILVLGQSATTEGNEGQLGNAEEQDRVRRDITAADAQHVEVTVDRDLIESYVDINHGVPAAGYPRFRLPVPDPEDLEVLVDSVVKLVPQGFRVATADLYGRLRLTRPEDDDEILIAPAAAAAPGGTSTELQAARRADAHTEEDLDALVGAQEWEPITRPIYEAVQAWAAEMGSLDEARRRLPELMQRLNGDGVTQALAADLLRARGLGDLRYNADQGG